MIARSKDLILVPEPDSHSKDSIVELTEVDNSDTNQLKVVENDNLKVSSKIIFSINQTIIKFTYDENLL